MKKELKHTNKISKIKLFFYTLCICGALCFSAPQAQATWFLDSISNLLTKVGSKLQKMLNTEENVTAIILEWLNSKIISGMGKESLELYDEIASDSMNLAKDIANGQYDVGNLSLDNVLSSLTDQVKGYALQQAELQKWLEDAIQAGEKKKLDKKNEMQKELAILESQREALDALEATDERQAQMDKLDESIAELRLAMRKNDEEKVMDSDNIKYIEKQMSILGEKMETINTQISEKNLQNMLQTEAMKLFKLDADDTNLLGGIGGSGKDETATYEDFVERVFLKEDESPTSQNVKRIMNERKKEFYDAVKSAMEMMVKTSNDIVKTSERSKSCTDTSVETADTTFGAMGLRQCVEMQNSLAATGYLDILLATIRLEVADDMQKWDSRYKLIDYEKDMSKFNLDDYMLREEDVFTKLKKSVIEKYKSYRPF